MLEIIFLHKFTCHFKKKCYKNQDYSESRIGILEMHDDGTGTIIDSDKEVEDKISKVLKNNREDLL